MNRKKFFRVLAEAGLARAGEIRTRRGVIKTPVFMPVGTVASVKALSPEDLEALGAQIILGNTYHLMLRPGEDLVAQLGGLHEFMCWRKPILTDSGGYQVSSLGWFRQEFNTRLKPLKASRIDSEGVTFYSHIDGKEYRLNAEKAIEIQVKLGSDILMAFDEATPNKGKEYARKAMVRTHEWLERSKKRWLELKSEESGVGEMFGIVQGGGYKDLRRESAEFVVSQSLPGIAIGGGTIGKSAEETEENFSWIRERLPKGIPRYLMGVGVGPKEVVAAVLSGADMFDCVAPTRIARMGGLYSAELRVVARNHALKVDLLSEFLKCRMNIANRRFKADNKVIDLNCDCYTCTSGFSRAYLRHLFKSRELLYYRLASIHNLRFLIRIVEKLREAIIRVQER